MIRFLNQDAVCFDSGSHAAAAAGGGGAVQSNRETFRGPYLIRGVPIKV